MPNIKQKTVRKEATTDDAKSRAAFDYGREFWQGPAGWVLVILMVVAGVAAIFYSYLAGNDGRYGELVVESQTDEQYGHPSGANGTILLEGPRSPVDGTPLAEDGGLNYYAVMLDNHSDARPGAAVADAPLVIEAPVEGGITRMMMFFPDGGSDLERIGPVRSARPYYVEWAQEYGAILVHVGGSPQALKVLTEYEESYNLNQMVHGAYFWRDRARYAPHNVYSSTDLLQSAREKLDYAELDFDTSRPFKQGGFVGRPVGDPPVESVSIDYSTASYHVTWKYDGDTNTYARYQGKGEFTDEDNQPVTADNVIVQFAKVEVIDYVGRKEIATEGEGDAVVFRDGRAIEAVWVKDEGSRTRFLFVGSDEEIPINVGTTWIQVVAEDTSVEY